MTKPLEDDQRKKFNDSLAEIFWSIAKKDLEATKILYEKKLYPQAVFFAEQCAEKIAKSSLILCLEGEEILESFGLELGLDVQKKSRDIYQELRGVGHDAIRFSKGLCSCVESSLIMLHQILSRVTLILQKVGSKNPLYYPVSKIYNAIVSRPLKWIENQKILVGESCNLVNQWSSEKFLKISKSEDELLKLFQKLEEVDRKVEKIFFESVGMLRIIDFFVSRLRGYSKHPRYVVLTYEGVKLVGVLAILSPHATISRYPEESNPLEEYTEKSPLVKHLDLIIRWLENAIVEAEVVGEYF